MSTEAHPLAGGDLRVRLKRDHQRLNRLFDQVVVALREGDREQAAALWTQFETGLRNHIDFEELHLLPHSRKLHPAAAAELSADHVHILSMLQKLSVGVDLHLTRADMVDDFVARLRGHAEREDALLYRWAQTEAMPVTRQHLPSVRNSRQ